MELILIYTSLSAKGNLGPEICQIQLNASDFCTEYFIYLNKSTWDCGIYIQSNLLIRTSKPPVTMQDRCWWTDTILHLQKVDQGLPL